MKCLCMRECKNNGIDLDVQKIYHDENGILFTQYFDKV